MNKPRPGLVAVDSGLVGQTLVEAVLGQVGKLPPPDPPGPAGEALNDPDLSLAAPDEGRLEMRLRRAGSPARVAEAELSDPAKQPATWLAALVRERLGDGDGDGDDEAAAIGAACAELARTEPVG